MKKPITLGLLVASAFGGDISASADEDYPEVTCYAKICPCPDDGRPKGVKIASPLFRKTVWAMQGHKCVDTGPNGVFLVTPDGMKKIAE
jgi:hypothetical protein